jgi:Raf kinase inhibitor-like YbhB/YbcL family protein
MKPRIVVSLLAGSWLFSVAPMAEHGMGAQQTQQQQTAPPPQSGAQPPAGQRQGGGGRGRGAVQVMSLTTTSWQDGGVMPLKHTQAGEEVSPPLSWSNPPETTQSFVLIVHDIDATNADATSDILHWMVWNIPASARGLPEGVPHGTLADGSRQISVTGPYYRGPAAPATGPEHHYVFDLYALDAVVDVPAVGQSVLQTRAAVMAAMAGHVRGKGTLIGRFKY